jgi:hypothetical protein
MKGEDIKPILLAALLFLESTITFWHTEQKDFPFLKGSYFGQTPPTWAPQVFASGIISTEKCWEAAPQTTRD